MNKLCKLESKNQMKNDCNFEKYIDCNKSIEISLFYIQSNWNMLMYKLKQLIGKIFLWLFYLVTDTIVFLWDSELFINKMCYFDDCI